MRAVLALLDAESTDRWIALHELVEVAYGTTLPTRSEEVAVARAVRRLAEQRLVWCQAHPDDLRLRQVRSRRWPPPERSLAARDAPARRPTTPPLQPVRATRPRRPETGRSIDDLRKDRVLAAKAIAEIGRAVGVRGSTALELHLRGVDVNEIANQLGVYPDAAERSLKQALNIVPRLRL